MIFCCCPCSVRFGQRHRGLCNIAKVWTLSTRANHYEQSLITILVARIFPSLLARSGSNTLCKCVAHIKSENPGFVCCRDAKTTLFLTQETSCTAFLSPMSQKSQHTRFEDKIPGQVSFGGFPATCASLTHGLKCEHRA